MELTEKLLQSMGGWPVFKEARAMHASGAITEASYEPPVLKGKYSQGGKQFLCGLRMRNSIDVENLCPCRDSRVRGIICAHSIAVGLQVLKPAQRGNAAPSAPAVVKASAREYTAEEPIVEFSIEGSLRHLEGTIQFRYSQPNVTNLAKETEALTQLLDTGFREEGGKAVLKGEDQVIRFFAAALPRLKQSWRVTEGERFQHVTKDFVRIEPQFAIREHPGWLDLQVHYTAGKDAVFSAQDITRLLQSGQTHTRLKDGRVAVADPTFSSDLEEVLHDCNPRQERGGYQIPIAAREYLRASIAGWKGLPDSEKTTGPTLSDLGAIRDILRPYQINGATWLLGKAQAKLGGLLADEMGLGKTVQTLAMLEVLPGTKLVVCPSSLVWNWKREAGHFAPAMRVLTLDGPQRERYFAEIGAHDLAVTSYALLRRDIERYKGITFATVILDEAQHIKNPDSQNAKAACALRAESRFILTGTPVENSIRDLWSLFEFLLPGYLGSREDFRDRYETPLLNGERGAAWQRLGRRIHPYLLRRRKSEILSELPDKIEQVLEVDLSEKQRATYNQLQLAARAQIDALDEKGGGSARMKIFTALLRLRQACCDLRLLGAPPETESTKVSALLELLEEAVDGGHRVLVFSQFTSMLDLIEQALEGPGISFCRMDGSTKDRGAVVQLFQEGNVPVFLISLKAGGVGLNLTAADTVIHFDPWWNPAVEAQATDRAHRIGQKSVVTAIKLIARDTIEERILSLQRKKRELLEGTLDADAALEKLSADDLRDLVG